MAGLPGRFLAARAAAVGIEPVKDAGGDVPLRPGSRLRLLLCALLGLAAEPACPWLRRGSGGDPYPWGAPERCPRPFQSASALASWAVPRFPCLLGAVALQKHRSVAVS